MSGYLPSFFFQNYQNTNGLVLAGGSLTTYISESTVPKSLFYDMSLQNPCPNPLQFDSAGICPQYFMESGLYTFVLKDSLGNIISTRDNVIGAVPSSQSVSATSASFKVKIDDNDTNPGYLWYKLSATDTIDLTNTGEKIAINVKNAYKIKANPSDSTLGYLNEKIMDTDTVILSISANKLRADFAGPTLSTPGYLFSEFQNTDSIAWTTSASKILANVISGKVQVSSGDTLEYLEEKIQAGSGIVFTTTEDINGKQIHISTTNSTTNAGKVKVTSADNLEYLVDKLTAGSGISISSSDNNITITNTANPTEYITSARQTAAPLNFGTNIGFQHPISAVIPPGTWLIGANANVAMVLSGALPTRAIASITSAMSTINESGSEGYAEKNQNDSPMTVICSPQVFTFTTTQVIYLSVYVYGSYSDGRVWGSIWARQLA